MNKELFDNFISDLDWVVGEFGNWLVLFISLVWNERIRINRVDGRN